MQPFEVAPLGHVPAHYDAEESSIPTQLGAQTKTGAFRNRKQDHAGYHMDLIPGTFPVEGIEHLRILN